MKKREFLKTAGLVGTGLVLGAGAGVLLKSKGESKSKNKKIVAINGCPDENGNTAYALSIIAETLQQQNINLQIIHIGKSDIRGCLACNSCRNDREKGCVHTNDDEQQCIEIMKTADAIIFASPTFFGGIAGTMKSFLDKAFFSASENFKYKVGAAIVTTRRTGASITFESLNQYFTISQMTIASSTYWNNIRGLTVDDLKQDGEGVRTLQNLANNIVKLI